MTENRLSEETSPYLLQHRHNPVRWYPWGPEAFEDARSTERPILLSIGYAACHWCHVMAHESFEDEEIATVMNDLFVNIKVDREERPDLDHIYQSALALLGEQGGWPLTMFLTPAGEPFWGGTYFPPTPRFGRPGFTQVLQSVSKIYQSEPEKVTKNVTALQDALEQLSRNRPGSEIPIEQIDRIAERLVREIDPFHGGIGNAPKFPQVSILKLLWRAWRRTKSEPFLRAVELTLTKMCQGGIYDHLGGGFARYSVDDQWLVPHFEKMLYDNAQLVELLTLVWQDTKDPLLAERVRETVEWVLREMRAGSAPSTPLDPHSPQGGFASTLDADSEGEEGKFYVWQEDEIDQLLGNEADLFKEAYDVTRGGNWEGNNILNRSSAEIANDPKTDVQLAMCRRQLLAHRDQRVWPGWDDKVLADWNGLMISALALASQAFGEPSWLKAAEDAFAFISESMERDGRLLHSWRHGRLKHPATLEDYANLCEAALALYEATAQLDYLTRAAAWVDTIDEFYLDSDKGGYFMTASDTEQLIVRSKSVHDSAVPAGNGTMVGVLARLYHQTGRPEYRNRAESLIGAFSGELERNFFPVATLINHAELLANPIQIVIMGSPQDDAVQAFKDIINSASLPNRILQVVETGATLAPDHPAHTKAQHENRATAYVCRGMTCSLPILMPDGLAQELQA